VPLPNGKKAVGYRYVCIMKLNSDCSLSHLKARFVANSQMYRIDYQDTFSLVAKITSVHLLISHPATHHLSLYQLNIKNAFLPGVFYIEQSPSFVAKRKSEKVC